MGWNVNSPTNAKPFSLANIYPIFCLCQINDIELVFLFSIARATPFSGSLSLHYTIQEYGLIGPVIFQPYSKAVVWAK